MAKYLRLENALNSISTGESNKGPFYQSASILEELSKSSETVEEFIDKLADYIEKKLEKEN